MRQATLVLAFGLAIAGCNSGKSRSSASPTTAAPIASAAPITSNGPTWSVFYTANPATLADAVKSIAPVGSANGDLLVGQTTGPIFRVDVNGMGTLEGSFGNVSAIARTAGGRIFASTGEPFFIGLNGQNGQVYERTGSGWQPSLDHPLGGALVATLGDDVYAFASQFAAVNSSNAFVNVLPAGASAWQTDVAMIASAQLISAEVHLGELWVGGSDNNTTRGVGRLVHGQGSTWAEVPLPNTPGPNELQLVTDLLSVGDDLYVSLVFLDTLGQAIVTGGEVLRTSDAGATFTSLRSYQNVNAPIALGAHGGRVYVGTLEGRLEQLDLASRSWSEDLTIPVNTGVFTIASIDSDTLLLGIRGNSGAEVYRLNPAAASAPPAPAPAPAPSVTYLGQAKSVLQTSCAVCHANAQNPGYVSLPLSFTDDAADYARLQLQINLASPETSQLLTKSAGINHAGGAVLAPGSPGYVTLQTWIAGGAPFN